MQARHLMRVESEIVTQNSRRFLGGDFAHQGNVVKNGSDVVAGHAIEVPLMGA